jgi:hypothetical protein
MYMLVISEEWQKEDILSANICQQYVSNMLAINVTCHMGVQD